MTHYTSEQLVSFFVEKLQEKKAENIISIDLREMNNSMAEFLIVCSGSVAQHVEALADFLLDETKKQFGETPLSKEGFENAYWILLDYVTVVVHIFQPQYREFYDIESLWADGKVTHYTEK